ncbi:MAG: mechanosensitive ion channel family protein [Anaerolineales bacterium]|nr:mechanosensitive ion channel family protein [Anaerolineales bacterium]
MFLGLPADEWIQIGISIAIFLGVILFGYPLLRWILRRVIGRLTSRTQTGFDDALVSALHPTLFLFLLVLTAQFGIERLDFLPAAWDRWIGETFYVLFAFVVALAIWRLIGELSHWYQDEISSRTETELDNQLIPFFRRVLQILLVTIVLIILLSHFEADVSALVTTLGVGSLAIALAAQETLSDTIAGFVIMIDRPYRIGDRIEIQDLGTWGDVVDIGLRSTRIRTRDNRMVIVPNSVIGKSLIVNYSYPDTMYRIQIHIGVSYGTDLEHARQTIIDAVREVEGVLDDHPVEALFLEFGDSALIFRVRWWLDSYEDTRRMFDRVNTAMYNTLRREGIELPFPQRDVHHYFAEGGVPFKIEQVRREPGDRPSNH